MELKEVWLTESKREIVAANQKLIHYCPYCREDAPIKQLYRQYGGDESGNFRCSRCKSEWIPTSEDIENRKEAFEKFEPPVRNIDYYY